MALTERARQDTRRGGRGRSGLPGPLTRVVRDRLSISSLATVACLALAATGVGEAASVRIEGEVDANWRGGYDILVRPSGSHLDLETTHGVIESNFLGFGGQGGISLKQLEAIRALPDVELAAPVSFLGYFRTTVAIPTIQVKPPGDRPALYELHVDAQVDDGLAPITMVEQAGRLVAGPFAADAPLPWVTDMGDLGVSTDEAGRSFADLETRLILPPISSPLLAVDPKAEMTLLGTGGSFLSPLATLADPAHLTVGTFDPALIPRPYQGRFTIAGLKEVNDITRSRPVVPLVVSRSIYASLRLRLDVSRIGQPLADYPPIDTNAARLDAAAADAGPGIQSIGASELDATALLRPLQPPLLSLVWPGQESSQGGFLLGQLQDFDARLAGRPAYEPVPQRPGGADLAFRIASVGIVGPDATRPGVKAPQAQAGVTTTGAEAAYRTFTEVEVPVARGFKAQDPADRPYLFAPLADFDLASVVQPNRDALDYVPFGAYDPPRTQAVAGPDGVATAPRELRPTLNAAGLLTTPPLAITDLDAAVLLRGDRPIDAIRVRVGGLAGFGPEARTRVERVASAIAALGSDVDIVAGSSPQPVEVYVPAYHLGQPTQDLGWIRQEWTTLGAAERVERGLSLTNIALLILSIVTALVLVAGLEGLRLARRREEIRILRALGWSVGEAARWFLVEPLLTGSVLLAVALGGWWLGVRSGLALAAVLALALMVPLGSLAGLSIALQPRRTDAGWLGHRIARSLRLSGPLAVGMRGELARPGRSALLIMASAIAAACLATGAGLVADVAARTGPTRLAAGLGERLQAYQFALLGATALAAAVFVVAALRADLRERRDLATVLAVSGWDRADVTRWLTGARLVVVLPGAGLAWIVGIGAGLALGLPASVPVSLIAALGAGSVLLAGTVLGRPSIPPRRV